MTTSPCRNGFTILELLVAIGVSIIAGFLLMNILVNSTGIFYKQSSKFSQGVDSNDALSEFKADIKESLAIVDIYTPSGGPTYTSGASTLVLKLPSLDVSGNIIAGSFDYLVFYTSQSQLRVRTYLDAQSKRGKVNKVLAKETQNAVFDYSDKTGLPVSPATATKVKLTLTLRQRVSTKFEIYTSTAEANLRND